MFIRKQRKKYFIILLAVVFTLTSMPVYAAESTQDDELSLFGTAAEMSKSFKQIGVDDQALVKLTNLEKKGPEFYNGTKQIRSTDSKQQMAKTYEKRYHEVWKDAKMTEFDPTIPAPKAETRAGGKLDGSPPADQSEQTERMDYITGVFEREYSADRYQPIMGQYLAYLYTSHYTENGTYDRDNPTPSFRKLLPNIISSEDIIEYNAFYERCNDIRVMNNFTAIGNALNDITSDGVKIAAAKEGMNSIKNMVARENEVIRQKFEELGISDEKTIIDTLAEITDKYLMNYDQAQSENELINLILETTDGEAALEGIINSYVDLMSLCAVSIYFNPVIGSIVGATWLVAQIMGNAITRINLLSLGTTLSSRVGYRLEIYAGLESRP